MKDYRVEKISSTIGKDFIIKNHYSHGCHNGPMCYGLFEERERVIGVCAFATPCSENVRRSIFGPEYKNSITELHRLILIDETPKNTESWFVSRALKCLKQDKPYINGIISFADETEGHIGTIYQALNFFYYGRTPKSTFYIDTNGRLRHPRQNGKNISKKEAINIGWKPVKREGKYRYLLLLPNNKKHKKDLLKMIKVKISKDYPKRSIDAI